MSSAPGPYKGPDGGAVGLQSPGAIGSIGAEFVNPPLWESSSMFVLSPIGAATHSRVSFRRSIAALLVLLVLGCGNRPQPRLAEAAETAPDAAIGPPAGDVPAPDREGDDWPQFLGPQGTGVSTETGLLDAWPADGPPLLWAREVGTGYSAPSVRGNRLVVHHRLRDEEIVECLRA
ncbi:MAG: hypothetical protein KF861_24415, partial [Planctomycetaceae bacterium]|nr:hypothetical protein [Planctomycetaceae bacterium]